MQMTFKNIFKLLNLGIFKQILLKISHYNLSGLYCSFTYNCKYNN
jgi:hypothetical protein